MSQDSLQPVNPPYAFPASDLDLPDALMRLLGSFWDHTYQGSDLVRDYAAARLSLERQARLDFSELVSSVSRLSIPVLHTDHWSVLVLTESQRNDATFSLAKFGDHFVFDLASGLRFDVPLSKPLNAWKAPDGLLDAPAIMNRIHSPGVTLTQGIDYVVHDGYLIFRDNPFDNALVPKSTVFENNVATDRQAVLWIFRGGYDRQSLYRQFGYALEVNAASTPNYKSLLNGLFDAIVQGSTATAIQMAWAAITGIQLVLETHETVEAVIIETDRQLVITDQHVYSYAPEVTITVAAGDLLNKGDPLTDGLLIYEFNRGQTPDAAAIQALTLGHGMLLAGLFGDLVFQNKEVPLVVETDTDGFSRVSFEVDGWPGDVSLFFNELHARGRANGQTLAHLLDQRPVAARDTEPTAGALPATINPFAFLCQNVLRDHAFVVKLKANACVNGVGVDAARFLRKIVPPQTVMIVIATLAVADLPIKMEGPGSPTAPGYEETMSHFVGNVKSETLGPELITEDVRLFLIGGRCV